ncbi:aminotransferase class III-fold pyridoxal phosphate-dependent enzyme [Chromobacterium sphagni]|uniref:aminotransferase class III-fold pyridoxal phosphate-dependent enzyme n=1 Tax=Chromobacterium sphagni TaxID=1903179 RepID=UPI0009F1BC95|nr:aminotransferase class III-fold pyridoxal phosphate-dependent enzyme [Chromobacterium sphagni]
MITENHPQETSLFERYVNPELGELTRRIGLDKAYVWGKDCILRDAEGNEYLDFLAAYGALPFGHSPKPLLDSLASFRDTLEPIFVQPSALQASGELARRLLEIAPGRFKSVTFQNSGAETVEAAIKACIAATGRRRILAARNSFHGKTLAALSATGNAKYQDVFFAPLPGFDFVDFGDAQALHEVLASKPGEYAAVILEPIQGEGGIRVPPPGYFQAVRAACDEFDVRLIIDEVQTGLGRTGRLFAIEKEGIQADCLLIAKALGGGVMPIGACLLGERAYSEDFQLKHSSTFGGNSLACRIGLRVLDLLLDRDSPLLANVLENGAYLLDRLRSMARKYSNVIAEVRGEGYLLGIEFNVGRESFEPYFGSFLGIIAEQENLVPLIAGHLLNVGRVRVAPTLNGANTLRVEPPLIATRADCDRFLQALEHTVAVVAAGNTGALIAHLVDGEPLQRQSQSTSASRPQPSSGIPRFGFILHPLELNNYREFDESLQNFSDEALLRMEERLNPLLEPFHVSSIQLQSPDGSRAEGDFIMVPRSAAQLAKMPVEEAAALIEDAMAIALRRGAQLIGLGGHTSIVTGGGIRVAGKGVPITSGNTYTMLSAIEAAGIALETTGRSFSQVRVAVVGATGSIGSAIARLIAVKAHRLVLVGNPRSARFNLPRFTGVIQQIAHYAATGVAYDPGSVLDCLAKRLAAGESVEQVAQAVLDDNSPGATLRYNNELEEELRQADVVLVATSSTERFIEPEFIKPGAIICDLSRPANVSHAIARQRQDVLVIDGGIVEAPGRASLGSRFGIPEDLCYACMAETMMMTLDKVFRDASLGLDLDNRDLELFPLLAQRHGFRIAGLRSFDQALEPGRWQSFLAQFEHARPHRKIGEPA